MRDSGPPGEAEPGADAVLDGAVIAVGGVLASGVSRLPQESAVFFTQKGLTAGRRDAYPRRAADPCGTERAHSRTHT